MAQWAFVVNVGWGGGGGVQIGALKREVERMRGRRKHTRYSVRVEGWLSVCGRIAYGFVVRIDKPRCYVSLALMRLMPKEAEVPDVPIRSTPQVLQKAAEQFDRIAGTPMDVHWRYANSSARNLPTKWVVLAVLVRSGLESALIWIYRRRKVPVGYSGVEG